MIDLFRSLPAWLIEHWFVGSILAITCLAAIYVVVLRVGFSIEDLRDIKRRNPDR